MSRLIVKDGIIVHEETNAPAFPQPRPCAAHWVTNTDGSSSHWCHECQAVVIGERCVRQQPRPSISAERVRYWTFMINQADDPMAAYLAMGEFLRETGVEVKGE